MLDARGRIQTARHLGRALQLVWRTAPHWTIISGSLVFVQGVLPLAALYLMKRIVDAVTVSAGAPDSTDAFKNIAFWILLAAGVAVFTALTRSLGEYATEAQSLHVTDAVADLLHAQSIAVDLEYYEHSSHYDTLHRAQREAPYRPTRVVTGLTQLATNGIALAGIVGLLWAFNGWLALILFCAALPGATARFLNSRRLFGFEQAQTEKERRAWYYHTILTDAPHAQELRLFNLGAFFRTRYGELRHQIRAGKLALSRRRAVADSFAQTLATAALFGSLAWFAWQTMHGALTVGDLLIYYLAFQAGLNFLQAGLRALSGLYEDSLFLANVYQFLDLAPKVAAPPGPQAVPSPLARGVAFHDVGFTYPNRDEESLRDIDLKLAPGEVVALVGENGSGKTTLVKLLCRLYDPTRGSISVDGVDLRNLDPVQWRREISVAFQDYAHYALTASENIWLGDVDTPPDPARIAEAARRSGAEAAIRRLPQGYDTMLGHWFKKGQELSGGEWQKIALARTFWRDARIVILDEPTSSLDPLAEAGLFREFRTLLDGRSAILISHRFSTVQMADRIYVLERGRIVERGAHAALLAQNGRYAQLYHVQAEHYREKGTAPAGDASSVTS